MALILNQETPSNSWPCPSLSSQTGLSPWTMRAPVQSGPSPGQSWIGNSWREGGRKTGAEGLASHLPALNLGCSVCDKGLGTGGRPGA